MSILSKCCKKAKTLNEEDKLVEIMATFDNIIRTLIGKDFDEDAAFDEVVNLVLCAMAADGKMEPQEYPFTSLMLKVASAKSDKYSYEYCEKYVDELRDNDEEFDKRIKTFTTVCKAYLPDLEDDITYLCALLCSVDGHISLSEKLFIGKLF